jgi:hypothetical protein
MPGLVPGTHVFAEFAIKEDVDGRDEPGHDGGDVADVAPRNPYRPTN